MYFLFYKHVERERQTNNEMGWQSDAIRGEEAIYNVYMSDGDIYDETEETGKHDFKSNSQHGQ